MMDLVINHFAALAEPADVDYSVFTPFDSVDYFHTYCAIDYNDYTDLVGDICESAYNNQTCSHVSRPNSRIAGWETRLSHCRISEQRTTMYHRSGIPGLLT